MILPYLLDLNLKLAVAMAALPEAVRARHVAYLRAAQRPDGGFAGRQGDSDLYYTGFALRSLAILGALEGPVAQQAARFLREQPGKSESVIDQLSLVYGCQLLHSAAGIDVWAGSGDQRREAIIQTVQRLRLAEGGYARTPEGGAGSTYQTFLVLSCLQLLDQPVPEPERVAAFLLSQRHSDGGFRESRVSKRAGTNPTAAGIGALRILAALADEVREGTVRFLAEMQTEEGGLRANTQIPCADLLSTFTGVLTLTDLGGLARIDSAAACRYVESLEQPDGGFHGALWDQEVDVEYTFYGLGCLGLLSAPGHRRERQADE